jgi:two-component system nitrogen regulation response regulator GlnG
MERLRATLLRVADLSVPVLLQGESGVGKELAALAIHQSGPRGRRPFVSVNLAAVPATTAASELFGHTAGAFTGATGDHQGYFQRADGGSLFLDEIGTTTPELQATLLRVLDSGEIQPVGAGRQRRVDVRVLAATDTDLEAAIQEGRFRAPLFHRLAACRVSLPPLRERRDDIGRLLFHFLKIELEAAGLSGKLQPDERKQAPWLPARLVARLAEHLWPGNVRQLHNAVRHLVIAYGASETIDTEAVMAGLESPAQKPARPVEPPEGPEIRPADISEDDLVAVMRKNRFGIQAAARALGISRTTLYALIERCPRLRKAKDLGRAELEKALEASGGDLDAAAERLEVSTKALKLRMRELGVG